MRLEPLTELRPGATLVVGGDRLLTVPNEVAEQFRSGDSLHYVEAAGELLLVPAEERRVAAAAVDSALAAFDRMGSVSDAQVDAFFADAAMRLEDDGVWAAVKATNEQDVASARRRGRSTTRLVASDRMRAAMVAGLRGWLQAPAGRGQRLERVEHDGFTVDLEKAELGVVAFVFEGRPNVIVDACGVLKGGNTVVFRIGRDALGTAREILSRVIRPALAQAGLPEGAVALVESAEHAAGWALFQDRRLGLAVARGSGRAVEVLGGLARQAGVAVSLHGTGGAWLMTSPATGTAKFESAVERSLDRKVCNTVNVVCLQRSESERLVPALLRALQAAGASRRQPYKLHVVRGQEHCLPPELLESRITVVRPEGPVEEAQVELLDESELGREWEWEETPEISLTLVENLEDAQQLFNRHSPRFVACLVSDEAAEHETFYRGVNAPFVGDGYTRWVDGQVALRRPELGLSNWEQGRLLARAGVLSGDSIYTVRTRYRGR